MKVSVVTPSFNQGEFIKRTLQSVAIQVGADIEHLVFDGGSTDDTADVLRQFGNGVRWVSERDKGQADAVNKGIRASDGEIIGWLNSDDIYYPGAVARVTGYFETHPDIDVVYGMADHIDRSDHAFEAYPTEPWDIKRLRDTCIISQPAAFFRRRVVAKYGLLDERLQFCMDYEYWLRLAKLGASFGYLEEKLAGSRLYAENKTLGSRLKVHAEINDMQKSLFGSVPDRWIWNYAHAAVDDRVDRRRSPRWFGVRLLTATIKAAWRWNGRLSPQMRVDLVQLWRRL
jgi:glycosyltransferase involved in cell wall biosynthesis